MKTLRLNRAHKQILITVLAKELESIEKHINLVKYEDLPQVLIDDVSGMKSILNKLRFKNSAELEYRGRSD